MLALPSSFTDTIVIGLNQQAGADSCDLSGMRQAAFDTVNL